MNRQLLQNKLNRHNATLIKKNTRFAAVAIIVFLNSNHSELFLIKRTVHPNDPWSGQIGLPGGHQEQDDDELRDTAIRETLEETGIQLTHEHLICHVDDQQGYAQGGQINLTVRPFVFALDHKPASIQINYELERYYWMPIHHFQHPKNHIYFDPMNTSQQRPGIRMDSSNILWGMTYRILTDFFSAIEIESIFIRDDYH